MKPALILLAWLCIVAGCGDNSGETSMYNASSDPSQELRRRRTDQQVVVDGNTAFALDLYAKLRQRPGNLVLSPASISLALGMTYGGARGETESQLARAMHFELSQERLHPALAGLAQALAPAGAGEPKVAIANRLWARTGFAFREEFLALTRDRYGAELARTAFPEPGRSEINTWTAKQTANKIQQLIKEGVVDPETALVLVSAIYFKGQWVYQFREAQTQPADFYVTPQEVVKVPMMHTKDAFFPYGETEEVQILELPYRAGEASGKWSMVILLPRQRDGLAKLEASLTPETLQRLINMPTGRGKFPVYLPRFSFSSEFSLLHTLQEMGLTSLHDFRGISQGGGLFLSAVEHGGFISVDEKGTEAAAATAVAIMVSGPSSWPVFRADHPFLLLIQHRATRSILFLGRFVSP